MRILLTGASGFVGQHLLQALLTEGHHVVCAVRKPVESDDPRLRYIHADFTNDNDKSTWLSRLTGIDAVINTVGIFRESRRQSFARLHTETPRALFAACAESHDVQMVIQLSALGADRDAVTPYHISKREADDYLASLPLRAYILQPSLVYGRDSSSARALRTLASMPFLLRFGRQQQLVQPIHIDDLVAAIVGVFKHRLPMLPDSGATLRVPLVGPQAMPFTEYLASLRRALGMQRQRVLRLPGPVARLMAGVAGLLPGSLLDGNALKMLERDSSADPTFTARLIGHPPRAVDAFIQDAECERAHAKLGWLLPVLRCSIGAVWIAAAIVAVGLVPLERSLALLAQAGVAPELQMPVLYGVAGLDLVLGLCTLVLARRRALWLVQLGLIAAASVMIAVRLPEYLLHPFGPLVKNLPLLAAIWLLYHLEDKP